MTLEQGYTAVRDYAVDALRTAWSDVEKVYVGPMRSEPKDYPHGAVWRSDAVQVENETAVSDTATCTFDVVGRFAYEDDQDLDAEIVSRWDALTVQLNASDHPGLWAGESVGFVPQVTLLMENLNTPDEKHYEVGVRWRVDFSFER